MHEICIEKTYTWFTRARISHELNKIFKQEINCEDTHTFGYQRLTELSTFVRYKAQNEVKVNMSNLARE